MKYIIEIKPEYEGTTKGIIVLGIKNNCLCVDELAIEELEELNAEYINNHFPEITKKVEEAYQRGLHVGESKCEYCDEYKRGLDDAWEAAKKISLMTSDEIEKVFPGAAKYNRYNLGYSGVEVIDKLKAYEEKQKTDDEIKVGDEVVWTEDEDVVIIVTLIYTSNGIEWCDGICRDGKVYQIITEHARKTGRHFDIILEEKKE